MPNMCVCVLAGQRTCVFSASPSDDPWFLFLLLLRADGAHLGGGSHAGPSALDVPAAQSKWGSNWARLGWPSLLGWRPWLPGWKIMCPETSMASGQRWKAQAERIGCRGIWAPIDQSLWVWPLSFCLIKASVFSSEVCLFVATKDQTLAEGLRSV